MRFPGTRIAALLAASALLVAAASGCAPGLSGHSVASGTPQRSGTLTVFAAASLKETFTRLAAEFENRHPGTKVSLSFAGSSDLATQISQGAPADVFASADTRNMERLSDASLIHGHATNFATNILEIAVPAGNPASISSFADLARPGVRVVVCASQVPCGAAAENAERETGTALKPVSEESSVADVLGKVTSGEADAGLVYTTDVKSAGGKVEGIPFPEAGKAVTTYPIAALEASGNTGLAAEFIALVAGTEGRTTLEDAGFGVPAPPDRSPAQ
ncbi:molybdate ABC transporter substrate-binding protein [Arthrobacter sp. NPDC093139]|uniref:molybdate ABC transporter substrate-binding protein n=1 Tax=Arthrobacter sp. NPDC093139 TaxID=3363945 RepID=UPI00380BB108